MKGKWLLSVFSRLSEITQLYPSKAVITRITVQIANELSIFAGLVRDSCESNACEINAYSFANTRTFREVLHMNQSETRGPRTG